MAKYASALREIRTRLGLSQAECATALGVALETFRTWDAGRRPAPEAFGRPIRHASRAAGDQFVAKHYHCFSRRCALFPYRPFRMTTMIASGVCAGRCAFRKPL